jgi:hypothetical protein
MIHPFVELDFISRPFTRQGLIDIGLNIDIDNSMLDLLAHILNNLSTFCDRFGIAPGLNAEVPRVDAVSHVLWTELIIFNFCLPTIRVGHFDDSFPWFWSSMAGTR